MTRNIYCTLDTETFGGAARPKGIYHLGGFIHDREGRVLDEFNYLIAEHYSQISIDDYAKQNIGLYMEMLEGGEVTVVQSEELAIEMVNSLCDFHGVRYMLAFNTGFDYCRTKCSKLIDGREFIDLYLMAVQTLATKKSYIDFCRNYNLTSKSKNSISTSAQTFYAYLIQNPDYIEEHTALEDARIEMEIFLACTRRHKTYNKNSHFYDYSRGKTGLIPPMGLKINISAQE